MALKGVCKDILVVLGFNTTLHRVPSVFQCDCQDRRCPHLGTSGLWHCDGHRPWRPARSAALSPSQLPVPAEPFAAPDLPLNPAPN